MEAEVLQQLRKAILDYNSEAAAQWAKHAVEEGIEPLVALGALTDAIREVGDGFGRGDLWLPDLVGAADAMQAAMPTIEDAFQKSGTRRGVPGCGGYRARVFGDIHTIGKSMVATMLTAEGFEVHDLGINVPVAKFVEAVKSYKPQVLAMSALLTTTAPEAKKVVDALKEEGLREGVKVMVGGGAITEGFAKSVGADGYDPTAPGAVGVARMLLGI